MKKIVELTMRLTEKGMRFSKRTQIIVKESAATYSCKDISFEESPLTRPIRKKNMNKLDVTRMFFPNMTYKVTCLEADEREHSRKLVALVESDMAKYTDMFRKCDEDLKKLLRESKAK